jgi:hypothetical protein
MARKKTKKETGAIARGKRKGIALVSAPAERVQIHFGALDGNQHGPAWDTMWDMLIAKFTPYALAIAERESRRAA